MTDHQHLVRCIEDSSNFYVEESNNEVIIRRMNSHDHFCYLFHTEAEYGQALANAVRWMLDQQYGVNS